MRPNDREDVTVTPFPNGRHRVYRDVVPIGEVFSDGQGLWRCARNGGTFPGGSSREEAVEALNDRVG